MEEDTLQGQEQQGQAKSAQNNEGAVAAATADASHKGAAATDASHNGAVADAPRASGGGASHKEGGAPRNARGSRDTRNSINAAGSKDAGDAKNTANSKEDGAAKDGKGGRGKRRDRKGGSFNRPSRRGRNQPKSDFDSRVLSARRVSRVVAGGRRFSLSVAVAVGDGSGKVGVGISKGQDMATATEKARRQAQKNIVQVALTPEKGIPSESVGKYCASVVQVRPAKGFVAGGAVRTIAELAGIQYISAKIQSRSKSHLNNARATVNALRTMKT